MHRSLAKPHYILLTGAAFLLPATSINYPSIFYPVAALLTLFSLVSCGLTRFELNLKKEELILLTPWFFYPAVVFIDMYFRQQNWVWGQFQESSRFLLVICIFFLVRQYGFNLVAMRWGVWFGAVGAGCWAYYQKNTLGIGRVWGGTSSLINAFGDISLLLGILSLVLFQPKWRADKRWLAVAFIALLIGMFGSLASGAKGGWISLPVITWFLVDLFDKPSWRKRIALLVTLTVSATLVFYFSPFIQSRVSMVIPAILQYAQTGEVFDGSVGIRIALWHSSWLIFLQHPWFGTGIGSFYPQLLLLVENGLIDPAASQIHHPHSQFFSSIAAYGVFGPLSIFSIYISFIWYCKIHISQHKSLAIAGVITAVAYMDFGLVEMIWDINNAGVLFVMMMALITGQLSHQARTKNLDT